MSKKIRTFSGLLIFIFAVCLPVSANAGFYDEETAEALFQAGELDLLLESSLSGKKANSVVGATAESVDFSYRVSGSVAAGTSQLCEDVTVKIFKNGSKIYTGAPGGFTAESSPKAGEKDKFYYIFNTDKNTGYQEEGCAVTFVFKANQKGREYGEAFFDREETSFVLSGVDFCTPNTSQKPNDKNDNDKKNSGNSSEDSDEDNKKKESPPEDGEVAATSTTRTENGTSSNKQEKEKEEKPSETKSGNSTSTEQETKEQQEAHKDEKPKKPKKPEKSEKPTSPSKPKQPQKPDKPQKPEAPEKDQA